MIRPGQAKGPSVLGSSGSPGTGDHKIKISSTDTTPDFGANKVLAGTSISVTKEHAGGNEDLRIANTSPETYKSKATSADTVPDFLGPKLLAGSGISLSIVAPGGNEQVRISATGMSIAQSRKIWVDEGRSDVYIASGTVLYPFKTVSAALIYMNSVGGTGFWELTIAGVNHMGLIIDFSLYPAIINVIINGNMSSITGLRVARSHIENLRVNQLLCNNISYTNSLQIGGMDHASRLIFYECEFRIIYILGNSVPHSVQFISCDIIQEITEDPWKKTDCADSYYLRDCHCARFVFLHQSTVVLHNVVCEGTISEPNAISVLCSLTGMNVVMNSYLNTNASVSVFYNLSCVNLSNSDGHPEQVTLYNSTVENYSGAAVTWHENPASSFPNDSSVPGTTIRDALENLLSAITTGVTDYFSASAINGWAASPTGYIIYQKIGHRVFVHFKITGVSDNATTNFTLPYQNNCGNEMIDENMSVADSGGLLDNPGKVIMVNGGNSVDCYKSNATSFPASGQKNIAGSFSYYTSS